MKLIDKIRRMFEKKVQVFLYHHILAVTHDQDVS